MAETQLNTNIYRYQTNIKFVLGDEIHEIDNFNIKSIVIDSDYFGLNMPMLFVTAAINKKVIDLMIQNQSTAKIIFNLQRAIANSDMPELYSDYIRQDCIYFIAEDVNKMNEFDFTGEVNENREDQFKLVSFGLLCIDHVNNNKKVINGVLSGNLSSIMYHLTGHIPIIIEPPTSNPFVEIYIPPTNSVLQSLKYLNSLQVLYDSPFFFFMDFDCAYLMSTKGRAIPKRGDRINKVQIALRNSFNESSKIQGMVIDEDNAQYFIEIDGIDAELSDAHMPDKSFTKLKGTIVSGGSANTNLGISSENVRSKTKAVRVANENFGMLNNITNKLQIGSIQLLVQKTDIDPQVLTPNKEYTISASDVYNTPEYDGKYILTQKRELYIREDEGFTMSTMLLFSKII